MRTLSLIALLYVAIISCDEQSPTSAPQPTTPDIQPSTSNLLLLHQYAENGDRQTLALADSLLQNPEFASSASDILTMKVIYFGKKKNYKEAAALCDMIIQKDYTYLQAYLEKGWLLFEQNKFNDALKVFELATDVKNNFAEAYFWKGRCYEKMKQRDAAIQDFKKALALDPSLEEAKTTLKSMGAIQ